MSEEAANVEMLKQGYRRWSESQGKETKAWTDICADDVCLMSLAQGRSGTEYLRTFQKRNELQEYFAGLARDWEMISFKMDEFIAQGDRVVVIGHCEWKYRKTGKVVSTPKVDCWRLANGKATEFSEFYDTAQVVEALG